MSDDMSEKRSSRKRKTGDGDSNDDRSREKKNFHSKSSCTASSSSSSSPIEVKRKKKKCTIPPEEYGVIERMSKCNLNEAFLEDDNQLDEGIDALSLSSSPSSSASSSSESTSYFLELVREMIASYPNEDQLAEMIVENYVNYMIEMAQQEPSSPLLHLSARQTADNTNASTNSASTNDDSVILLESKCVQTNSSFEEQKHEDADEENTQ